MFDEEECINTIKSTAFDLFLETKSNMNIDLAKSKIELIQIHLNRLNHIREYNKSNNQGVKK